MVAPDVERVCRPGEVDQPLLPEGRDRRREDPVEEPDRFLAEAAPADLIPGISLLLKEGHPVPESPEQVGGGAPGRPAPDNDNIIIRPIHHLLPPRLTESGTYHILFPRGRRSPDPRSRCHLCPRKNPWRRICVKTGYNFPKTLFYGLRLPRISPVRRLPHNRQAACTRRSCPQENRRC